MKIKVDSQFLMAFGVLMISFAALFVSIRQASIMNQQTNILIQQTKSANWPHLTITLNRSFIQGNISELVIFIQNRGTGPAIIESIRVLFDDQPTQNWADFYAVAQVPDSIAIGHSNSSIFNQVITANEDLEFIGWPRNPELRNWIYENGNRITIEVCYKSVFDEYWNVKRVGFQSNLELSETTPIEHCTFDQASLFLE